MAEGSPQDYERARQSELSGFANLYGGTRERAVLAAAETNLKFEAIIDAQPDDWRDEVAARSQELITSYELFRKYEAAHRPAPDPEPETPREKTHLRQDTERAAKKAGSIAMRAFEALGEFLSPLRGSRFPEGPQY